MKTKLTLTNVWIWCKVTPYFVPLQTFPHLFLQLVATARPMVACYQRDARIVPTGDKSRQLPQKLTCHKDYFYFFLKIFLSFKNILYFCRCIQHLPGWEHTLWLAENQAPMGVRAVLQRHRGSKKILYLIRKWFASSKVPTNDNR